jgi:hypothetical protein
MRDLMEVGRSSSAARGLVARFGVGAVGSLGIAALALALAPGCGSPFSGVCNLQKQCTLGNSDDQQAAYDTCIAVANTAEEVANDYSCSTAYGTYATCVESSASCVSGQFMTGDCSKQLTAVEACEAAASAHGGVGSGLGPGNSGSVTIDDEPFSCDETVGGTHLCDVYSNLSASQVSAATTACTQASGTTGTFCPSTNALGVCSMTESGITVAVTYYAGGSLTASSAQSACTSSSGTWSPG